jgi:hypothetical protein
LATGIFLSINRRQYWHQIVEVGQLVLVYAITRFMVRSLKFLVVWKITPLFASWATSPSNLLFRCNVLDSSSIVLELGCGISGIIGLSLAPLIKSYVLTDQDYVLKLLNQNLSDNEQDISLSTKSRKCVTKPKRGRASTNPRKPTSNIVARALDWEVDEVTCSLTDSDSDQSFDVVIACDCIYNDALIKPLVQTCIDASKLRMSDTSYGSDKPTVCIVAQQLRSPEVFEGWLIAFRKAFRVWRIPDEEFKSDSGFVIHIGILR